jgi:hypothetical protein
MAATVQGYPVKSTRTRIPRVLDGANRGVDFVMLAHSKPAR